MNHLSKKYCIYNPIWDYDNFAITHFKDIEGIVLSYMCY